MTTTPEHLISCVLSICSYAAAQTTTYFVPSGFQTAEAPVSNTVPWWSTSGVYQQVHDAAEVAAALPGPAPVLKRMSFRKDGLLAGSITARMLDAQITLGTTTVHSGTITTTFATNLGQSPAVVVPYTTFSLPGLSNVSVPNPPGWPFPFATPFTHVKANGNLCWELRFKNNTVTVSAPCDAVAATPTLGAFFGTGCLATGQTANAAIGARTVVLSTGQYSHTLIRAAGSAPAAMFLGTAAQHVVLPGFCSAVETIPVVTLNGTTTSSGDWTCGLLFGPLGGQPGITLYAQFVFVDAGLPGNIGVSDCSPVTLPPANTTRASRVYLAPNGGPNGNENATTGIAPNSYNAMLTGFDV